MTSSLHLARLATALSARMQDPDAVDISELMHLETIGELIDFIAMAQDELSELPAGREITRQRAYFIAAIGLVGSRAPRHACSAEYSCLPISFAREKWRMEYRGRPLARGCNRKCSPRGCTSGPCRATHRSSDQIPPQRATRLHPRDSERALAYNLFRVSSRVG